MSAEHPIKKERVRRGFTQRQLAQKLDTSEMTVSRWERGEHLPRPRHLKLIKRRLGIDPAKIITYAMGAV
jgi:putative transcriptional regulator